jgi:hypothetical protein
MSRCNLNAVIIYIGGGDRRMTRAEDGKKSRDRPGWISVGCKYKVESDLPSACEDFDAVVRQDLQEISSHRNIFATIALLFSTRDSDCDTDTNCFETDICLNKNNARGSTSTQNCKRYTCHGRMNPMLKMFGMPIRLFRISENFVRIGSAEYITPPTASTILSPNQLSCVLITE